MKLIQYTTPTLTAWTPFNRLAPFQDLLDSAFDSNSRNATRVPPMDVHENEDAVTVSLELGGMKKEDFEISLEDDTLMVYKTSTEYCPPADSGIRWDSFGHDWRLSGAPVTSDRDAQLGAFSDFVSPF
jgi:HSP20 family molecular chaperone IbpA